MSEKIDPAAELPAEDRASAEPANAGDALPARRENRRWWIRLVVQPIALLVAGVLLIAALGAAQRLGWIAAAGANSGGGHASAGGADVRYVCPMMCTPPQTEPGRCPVCAMELVPATSGGGESDGRSIQVDPVARRVANIRTAAARSVPLVRRIRAIGELSYDEGTLKTIAAYVDGRLERLYADYTGVVVAKGDHLALLYSPQLYSSQVELLAAKRLPEPSRAAALAGVSRPERSLYESARQRLIEFGMTAAQIDELERAGRANSRLHLCAPMSGTVIEKLAVEGQYVKTGQAIYRLADLSTVWLMLELFPEDVAAIRYGQQVEAEVQSLPGRTFTGRVAFIDPTVKPQTRTVGVRVVIPNEGGLLRVGDYAKATIAVQVGGSGDGATRIYDPELADKWISPRHPHVIESSSGKCRVCGVGLVPAANFGFASKPTEDSHALVVPRSAVLMAGGSSVVYVEVEPGRFEMRSVVLGPSVGDEIAILDGVKGGEHVACSGNFLIDSQMQLAGNPSLIDPKKVRPSAEPHPGEPDKLIAALSKLSTEDRGLAERQSICPVTKLALGSMGVPKKVEIEGRPVFICCEGCRSRLLQEPATYMANLAGAPSHEDPLPQMELPAMGAPQLVASEEDSPATELPRAGDADADTATAETLSRLSPSDLALAKRQRLCPVADMPLGSMGTPIKVDVNGRPVFICCEGCRADLLAEPAKYLAKLPGEKAR